MYNIYTIIRYLLGAWRFQILSGKQRVTILVETLSFNNLALSWSRRETYLGYIWTQMSVRKHKRDECLITIVGFCGFMWTLCWLLLSCRRRNAHLQVKNRSILARENTTRDSTTITDPKTATKWQKVLKLEVVIKTKKKNQSNVPYSNDKPILGFKSNQTQ